MTAPGQTLQTYENTRISDFRRLRRRVREIYRDARSDLEAFQRPDGTFSTLPPAGGKHIHVTTTCTALMALIAAGELDALCPPGDENKSVSSVFKHVVEHAWESEGLEADNAFSVAFVLRAAGFLVNSRKLSRETVLKFTHDSKTLQDIAKAFITGATKDFTSTFGVRIVTAKEKEVQLGPKTRTYPPKAAIVYWFVDGVDLLSIDVGDDGWRSLILWAAQEFTGQIARTASDDDAVMDPVSMAMAACLISRLGKIMNKRPSTDDDMAQLLPSKTELDHAISLLFAHQRPSGIWPKYFPMFHFLTAGANYCFTFEMLEALVNEMDATEIFDIQGVLAGLSSATSWCVLNRLRYQRLRV